jgi:hypothetical protein
MIANHLMPFLCCQPQTGSANHLEQHVPVSVAAAMLLSLRPSAAKPAATAGTVPEQQQLSRMLLQLHREQVQTCLWACYQILRLNFFYLKSYHLLLQLCLHHQLSHLCWHQPLEQQGALQMGLPHLRSAV